MQLIPEIKKRKKNKFYSETTDVKIHKLVNHI